MDIKERIRSVEERIAAACEKSGRNRSEIELIAVTKTIDCAAAGEAFKAGLSSMAENRPQMLAEKMAYIPQVRWHLIGHLQTNKVKTVVGKVALIHSIDSEHLLSAVNSCAKEQGIVQDVLLEVNISGEESKFGLTKEEVPYIINKLENYENALVRGIMTMAPLGADEAALHSIFSEARELRDKYKLEHLSMGMSGDFEAAIEEGATMIRLGSILFK